MNETKRRNLFSACLFAGMLAGPLGALAADLPPPPPPPPVEMRPAVYDWSGAYGGVVVGGGFVDNEYTPIPGNDPELAGDGVVGGGVIGYNYQMGSLVIGLEADAMAANIDPTNSIDGVEQDVSFLATIRARFGWAMDNTLFYGTGGVAWARSKITLTGFNESQRKTHIGYVVGGGMEHAFSEHFTGRLEYLYGHFKDKNYVYTPGTVVAGIDDLHIIRAGLVWKF